MAHNGYGHAASLLGMHGNTGWWYYFPVAFALKTTIPFLLISLGALIWGAILAIRHRSVIHVRLLIPILIYSAIAMSSAINIGIRHFLPVFPFLLILSGGLLQACLIRWKRGGAAAIGILMCWSLGEAIRVYPNYTAYLNELASQPGWRYLSDSNVEWGDDAQDLAVFLKSRGVTHAGCALLGGWMTMKSMGIQCVDLLNTGGTLPDVEYVAIGASFLNGSTVPFGDPGTGRHTNPRRSPKTGQ